MPRHRAPKSPNARAPFRNCVHHVLGRRLPFSGLGAQALPQPPVIVALGLSASAEIGVIAYRFRSSFSTRYPPAPQQPKRKRSVNLTLCDSTKRQKRQARCGVFPG